MDKSIIPVILSFIHHRRNPSESIHFCFTVAVQDAGFRFDVRQLTSGGLICVLKLTSNPQINIIQCNCLSQRVPIGINSALITFSAILSYTRTGRETRSKRGNTRQEES
jgi:hypothetical protein